MNSLTVLFLKSIVDFQSLEGARVSFPCRLAPESFSFEVQSLRQRSASTANQTLISCTVIFLFVSFVVPNLPATSLHSELQTLRDVLAHGIQESSGFMGFFQHTERQRLKEGRERVLKKAE